MEIRPDVGASLAAGRAYEPRFEIGKPNVIWPSIPADCRRMAALVVGAIDQETANARRTHFGERNFLLALLWRLAAGEGGHAPLKRSLSGETIASAGLERRSGEPGNGTGVEARQERGFYRLLAAAHCRQRSPLRGVPVFGHYGADNVCQQREIGQLLIVTVLLSGSPSPSSRLDDL
jgi:hypothetical protein